MDRAYRGCFTALLIATSTLLCTIAMAQGPAAPSGNTETSTELSTALPDAPPAPPSSDPASDNWRVKISIYGWFPGIHGTAGVLGHNAGIHESFSDVFHVLKGVIPIAVEADKGRFVMPLDFFWVKLGDDHALPLTDITDSTINVHITESIFTPKIGYRLVDGEHLKIDALAGIRYWYTSLNLTHEPSGIGNTQSASWVDGLGGARFILPLSEKAAITVGGDGGGGGASLDYQAVGLFTYNFTPKLGIGLGWRYLDVNYSGNHQYIYDVAQTGALAGLYLNFGAKPPLPASASCTVSPTDVMAGAPVAANVSTQNFNPKHTVDYKWSGAGLRISGTGSSASVDTTGLAPGRYTVGVTATDPKEKKNNTAICNTTFTVLQPPPPKPPVASCSASPTTIAIGEPSTIRISASSPEGWPLTYNWTSTGGQLSGNGPSATLTPTNADAGNTITVTGTATDDHNLSASCTAQVNVPAVAKCTTTEDWGECTFEKNPKKPWRVDNDCKDTLDKLSLRLQQMPNGKLDIVGYTNQEESVSEQTLGSQRAVNVKYYLTTDGPNKVDPSRVQPRQGGAKGQATHFYFVPEGNMCGGQLEEGTVVDEGQVKPQSRNAPAPKKKAKPAATQPPTAQ